MFAGGVSKRTLAARDPAGLHRFAAETRRAERVHWVLLGCGPLFFLWNPFPLGLAMLAYALVANLPCIVIQRYNRARLDRIGRRRGAGPGAATGVNRCGWRSRAARNAPTPTQRMSVDLGGVGRRLRSRSGSTQPTSTWSYSRSTRPLCGSAAW